MLFGLVAIITDMVTLFGKGFSVIGIYHSLLVRFCVWHTYPELARVIGPIPLSYFAKLTQIARHHSASTDKTVLDGARMEGPRNEGIWWGSHVTKLL